MKDAKLYLKRRHGFHDVQPSPCHLIVSVCVYMAYELCLFRNIFYLIQKGPHSLVQFPAASLHTWSLSVAYWMNNNNNVFSHRFFFLQMAIIREHCNPYYWWSKGFLSVKGRVQRKWSWLPTITNLFQYYSCTLKLLPEKNPPFMWLFTFSIL